MRYKFLYFYIKILRFYYNFLCIFILSKGKRNDYRREKRAKIKKIYLRKYLYALDNVKYQKNGARENIIWICWLQGEQNAPEIVKMCINSIRKLYENKYKIIVITNDNIGDYITEKSGGEGNIPNYILEKHRAGYISNIHFSDILRLCLLSKYGGIWIDATVFLSGEIPNAMITSNFFAFHMRSVYKSNNWFLIANSNNILVNHLRALMLEYWKYENKLIDYFIYHLFFDLMIDKDVNCREAWSKVPLFYDTDSYLLFGILFQEYDKIKYERIREKTTINKLSYKFKNKDAEGTLFEKLLESYTNNKHSV